MKNLAEHIKNLAEACLHDASLFIVDINVSTNPRMRKVTVLVDADNGLEIDVCGEISRELGEKIEEAGIIEEAYTLEVSSPGVDFPLNSERLYRKNIGRSLKLHLADGEQVKGELLQVSDEGIVINQEVKVAKGKKISVEERSYFYKDIQKANVIVLFK